MTDTLWLPTLQKEIARPWFLPTAERLEELRKLAEGTYFLIRNSGVLGERLSCTRCGQKHQYISLMCVERPFSGLSGGLYGYYRAVGDNGLRRYLSPEEGARYDGIVGALGVADLSTRHPDMARRLNVAPSDAQLGAFALGVLEQIPVTLAQKYAARINLRGIRPRFALTGLEAA